MTTLADKAARGAGVTLAAQVIRFVLQFGSVVVLARLLTPEDFGLVAMVAAVVGIASVLRDFGLSSAAIQSKTLSDGERDNLFWLNSALGLAAGLCVAALTPLIVILYDEPKLVPVVLVLSCVFLISGVNTQYSVHLARNFRFLQLSSADIIGQTLGIAVAILVALNGGTYWAIVAQQVSVAAVTLVVNAWNCGWLPGRPRRDVSVRRFLRFGLGLLGTQGISYITKNIDNVLIGAVWGPALLGLYSRAYQLLMMPLNQINAPMTRVVLPVLSKVQDDPVRYHRYVSRVQLVACYVTATVFAVAAVLADPLVRVIFGPQWLAMSPIFMVLAIGGVFRALSNISYWIYLSRGRTGAQLRLYLWTRPLMIGLIAAGLPWGPIGVAVGHSIAYAGYWAASMWAVGRATGVRTGPLAAKAMKSVAFVSIPAAIGAGGALLLPVVPFAQLVIGTCGAIAMIALVALVIREVREDLVILWQFARKATGRTGRTA